MINEAQVFLAGYVARDPKFRTTSSGTSTASLRVGYTPRWVDRETGEWTDGMTSFVTVICWRALADNVAICLRKGEPVLVKGRLQVRPYQKDGVPRLAVEVEASSIGHDLARGVANFQRSRRSPGDTAAGQRPGDGSAEGQDGSPGQDDTGDSYLGGLNGSGDPAGLPADALAQDRAQDSSQGGGSLDRSLGQAAEDAGAEPADLSAPF
ncbi:MAG TPA: single-stranded DNA-binding protein [Streptosporangiaceae bacterium]|nr:single-stranded DNA-binding protein [Streptosporangiaceae bacterium]